MKKLILLSLSAIALSLTFSSCKKGENDPFLSLRSRKARLVGEWNLTKMTETNQAEGLTASTTYDGTTITGQVISLDGSSVSLEQKDPETYSQTITFKKDGTFTRVTSSIVKTTTYTSTENKTEEGTWMFLHKNKGQEVKNKEAIALSVTKSTSTSPGEPATVYNYTGVTWPEVYLIDQLKNKELVLKNEGIETELGESAFGQSSVMTFTAK